MEAGWLVAYQATRSSFSAESPHGPPQRTLSGGQLLVLFWGVPPSNRVIDFIVHRLRIIGREGRLIVLGLHPPTTHPIVRPGLAAAIAVDSGTHAVNTNTNINVNIFTTTATFINLGHYG
ncbi:hypothetical protein [Phaffia rhodozyma]|uniref:Uncharacterized protein n=1 Tax=Phaffia rhodozyma TaxID=264483 RepID=A0A0F7SHB9_PHARH|nr:hypothetical protein [Phaffia rhodozyma]